MKRVLISFEEETIAEIDKRAEAVNLSRNAYIVQICRKHIGFPSIIKEDSE